MNFEIERILEIIKKNKYKTVGLQFPEGLKDYATEMADKISEKAGCEIIISADPCYGACDLVDKEMESLGCEALFHFGHAQLITKTAMPVIYVEVKMDLNPIPLLSENLSKLPKKIGLVSTVQHVHLLGKVKSFLEKNGFEAHIGNPKGRVKYPGQVLGCSFVCAKNIAGKVDCFLYIGSGNFHPLGVALATRKKTFICNIEMNKFYDINGLKNEVLRQRYVKIAKAKYAVNFGIIIGEKTGQRRKIASKIKRRLEKLGKKVYLISMNEITPENLISFRKLDAFVNTACPRIAIDDAHRYKQAILTPAELEILLGDRNWEDYRIDEISSETT